MFRRLRRRLDLDQAIGPSRSGSGRSRQGALECATAAGAWLNGRAPDSGSGGSRFESWRASQLPLECGASRVCATPPPWVAGGAPMTGSPTIPRSDFIRDIVAADLAEGRV